MIWLFNNGWKTAGKLTLFENEFVALMTIYNVDMKLAERIWDMNKHLKAQPSNVKWLETVVWALRSQNANYNKYYDAHANHNQPSQLKCNF